MHNNKNTKLQLNIYVQLVNSLRILPRVHEFPNVRIYEGVFVGKAAGVHVSCC